MTSTLTWLKANEKRLKEHSKAEFEKKLKEDGNDGKQRKCHLQDLRLNYLSLSIMVDPPWVIAHTVKSHLQELESKEAEIKERLAKAREKEVQRKREAKLIKFGGRNKRQRVAGPEYGTNEGSAAKGHRTGSGREDGDDEHFLPLDTGAPLDGRNQQDDNLSSEVKALLRQ